MATFLEQLAHNGPGQCQAMSVEEARGFCRRLAERRYENFSVLSRLVPRSLRDDFAAVYAFCRWSDDLGDEVGDPQRASELLEWWRSELRDCFDGSPRHPVFIALEPTIRRHDLPIEPFDDLISAFELDQRKTRYETWSELLDYCRQSADPVGRLVLMVCGERRERDLFKRSDAICTALQLTNHWQDVKRDLLERDRIYIPADMHSIADFEQRLLRSATLGHGCDQTFLTEYRNALRGCVERTWALFEQASTLLEEVGPRTRPMIWLFLGGGRHVLHQIEMWNYETCLHRPRLSRVRKAMLVAGASWRFRGESREAEAEAPAA